MPPLYLSRKYTIGDTAAPLESNDLIFTDIDLQCQSEAIDYGDVNCVEFELAVGDILSYRASKGVNLKEIFFKNHTPASVGYIIVAGILK